jgi:hypothetical protein
MATPLTTSDVMQCRIVGKDPSGGEWVNVLHFEIASTTANPTDLDFIHELDANIAAAYKGVMSDQFTYDGIQGTIINRDIQPATVVYTASAGPGGVASNSANTQATGLISWYTAFGGRKYRGRTFVAGVYIGAISTTGFPGSSYLTLLAALASAIFGYNSWTLSGRSGTCNVCLYRKLTAAVTLIENGIAIAKFATQRRRGNYGKNRTPPI